MNVLWMSTPKKLQILKEPIGQISLDHNKL